MSEQNQKFNKSEAAPAGKQVSSFRRSLSEANRQEKPEFDQKLLDVARVARIVAGGRRFSFRTVVAIGNRAGKVGIGVAKGKDVSQAVDKAVHEAKKRLISVPIKGTTISYDVSSKYGAVKILLKPAAKGRGLVAGGVVRIICDLAGIKDISAKIVSRSTNKLNNAKATIEAFKKLSS